MPVVYGYISDAHEKKTAGGRQGARTRAPAVALRRDRPTPATRRRWPPTTRRSRSSSSVSDDGINASNTVFLFSNEEGDHFAGANVGRTVQPNCTGTPGMLDYTCSYANQGTTPAIGEQFVNIHGLLQHEFNNTTPFYDEPQGNSVYITGNPGPTDPMTRQLERDFGDAQVFDTFDNATENLTNYEVDPEVEQLLHFTNADPNRTPSFTIWPKGDFFMASGTKDTSQTSTAALRGRMPPTRARTASRRATGSRGITATTPPRSTTRGSALSGPGVANKGVDGRSAAEGPNSADGANSDPKLVTQSNDPGTWGDETDMRPTLLALVGLKDDYVEDGRVLVEDLTNPPDKAGQPKYQSLAVCYKQLNSSVGQFGTDMIVADTAALETGSSGDDSTYDSVLSKIQSLGAARDALATKIKSDLFNAEFNNTPIPGANDLKNCTSIVAQANALAGQG